MFSGAKESGYWRIAAAAERIGHRYWLERWCLFYPSNRKSLIRLNHRAGL